MHATLKHHLLKGCYRIQIRVLKFIRGSCKTRSRGQQLHSFMNQKRNSCIQERILKAYLRVVFKIFSNFPGVSLALSSHRIIYIVNNQLRTAQALIGKWQLHQIKRTKKLCRLSITTLIAYKFELIFISNNCCYIKNHLCSRNQNQPIFAMDR